jgi:hypothetical protein
VLGGCKAHIIADTPDHHSTPEKCVRDLKFCNGAAHSSLELELDLIHCHSTGNHDVCEPAVPFPLNFLLLYDWPHLCFPFSPYLSTLVSHRQLLISIERVVNICLVFTLMVANLTVLNDSLTFFLLF